MNHDPKSEEAAAELSRLALMTAILRAYREHNGHEAPSCEALEEWVQAHPELNFTPTDDDYEAVRREEPDLVLLADRSNPFLSGRN